MKHVHGVAALFLLACCAQAAAQDVRCDAGAGKPVTLLRDLPLQVLDVLGYDKGGTAGIAEIGGKFNPGDFIVDNSVPMRRLVGGAAGTYCIALTVEYGGVGHYQKTLEFRLRRNGWVQTKGQKPELAPPVLPARHVGSGSDAQAR